MGMKELLEEVGLGTADRAAVSSYIFDGRNLALWRQAGLPLSDEEKLHEACHWVAATPDERLLPEYGMGAKRIPRLGGEYVGRVKKMMTPQESQLREFAALLLHQRVGNVVGLGFQAGFPIDQFVDGVASLGHATWCDLGAGWLASKGVDADATSAKMIAAYRYLQ